VRFQAVPYFVLSIVAPVMTVPVPPILGAREPLVAVQRMPLPIPMAGMRVRTEGSAARVTTTGRVGGAGKHEHDSRRE